MKKISKKVREEAIEALLCCADDRGLDDELLFLCTPDILGHGTFANWIADRAWAATGGPANDRIGGRDPQTRYLEAAALLRDGWNPGDEVIRLGGAS